MAFDRFNDDLNIIQKLDDEPNDVGGLTASELKGKFDEGANKLKNFINDSLIPQLEAVGALAIIQSGDMNVLRYLRLNGDKVLETSVDGHTWESTGSSGHIVLNQNGDELAQRSRLQFANCEVTDNGEVTVVHGITGPMGLQGIQGPRGYQGDRGEKGDKGAAWYPTLDAMGTLTFTLLDSDNPPPEYNIRGPQGPQGVQGQQGVAGARGPQGVEGPRGPQGVRGPAGEAGPEGRAGPTGPSGETGPVGPVGPAGENGQAGPAGPQGQTGPAGAQGPMGPQGEKGVDGKDGTSLYIEDVYSTLAALKNAIPSGNDRMYMVQSNKECYIWSENAGDWVSVGKLEGATGPQGPAGSQGVQGPAGTIEITSVVTGNPGTSASVVNNGTTQNAKLTITIPRGAAGATGPAGPAGPAGPTGPVGPAGPAGPTGVQGQQGIQGPEGPAGSAGAPGPAGADGKSAYSSAVEGGYSGTETAFNSELATIGEKASLTYVNEQIAAIPTPDVSGQIEEHNTSANAHTDIREALEAFYDSTTSRNANTVLAGPDGSSGAASFRALTTGDIPGLPASKVTSGKLSSSRLPTVPISKGGTGATSAAEALANLGITYGTADLTAGSSPLATGAIYLVYQ